MKSLYGFFFPNIFLVDRYSCSRLDWAGYLSSAAQVGFFCGEALFLPSSIFCKQRKQSALYVFLWREANYSVFLDNLTLDKAVTWQVKLDKLVQLMWWCNVQAGSSVRRLLDLWICFLDKNIVGNVKEHLQSWPSHAGFLDFLGFQSREIVWILKYRKMNQ